MDLIDLAPIVLFVYNRPWVTQQTLEALSKNTLAKESILYIYADGARDNATEAELLNIEKTRNILKMQEWCGEVHIIESEKNKGLASSIKYGVTEIVNKYGKIIVLEDDIFVSKYFLEYMNDALSIYEKTKKVMHISSFLPPKGKQINLPETFFLKYMSCWGWGTWSDRWALFIDDIDYLYNTLKNEDMNYAGVTETDMFDQIERNYNGTLKTWAIKWYATIFLNEGLCLYPKETLVDNIGFDGSGMHCNSDSNLYKTKLKNKKIIVLPVELKENNNGKQYLIYAFKRINNILTQNYTILERFRNKNPSFTNFLFRIYNNVTRKYK